MVGLLHWTDPCIHLTVLNLSKDFCILVQLVPKLLYHSDEEMLDRWDGGYRAKRKPIAALTVSLLLGLSVAGAATGVTSLVLQGKNYQELRPAIDLDREKLKESITHLQESLTSLSELVLQSRRGLDLLFLQTGVTLCSP